MPADVILPNPHRGDPSVLGPDLTAALADHRAGRRVAAERVYRRIEAADAADDGPVGGLRKAHATHLLGLLARDCGHLEPALDLVRRSVDLLPAGDPAAAMFRLNLAAVLSDLGRDHETVDALRDAVRVGPGYAPAHLNLGVALERVGDLPGAEAALRRAAELQPDGPDAAEAHRRLGGVLGRLGRPAADAVDANRAAVRLDPGSGNAWRSLGGACAAAGDVDAAVAAHRRAVAPAPGWSAAGSELLFTLYYHPAYGPAEHLAEARAWAARHADPLTPDRPGVPERPGPGPAAARRVRVAGPAGPPGRPAVGAADRAARPRPLRGVLLQRGGEAGRGQPAPARRPGRLLAGRAGRACRTTRCSSGSGPTGSTCWWTRPGTSGTTG
jgi:tetratricopeptide (TPR) repeat protein